MKDGVGWSLVELGLGTKDEVETRLECLNIFKAPDETALIPRVSTILLSLRIVHLVNIYQNA